MMMSPPINPGENVQSHGWKKLRHLWRDVNSLYKEVLFNYTKSGNHESEFVNFCDRVLFEVISGPETRPQRIREGLAS